MDEDVDLSQTPYSLYQPSKPGYRHHDQATVGWLDGHCKTHRKSFVSRRQDEEDGIPLFGNDRLIHWNLH